jgi:heme-degrading monooxygenase HmoA
MTRSNDQVILRQVRSVVSEQDLPAYLDFARQVVARHIGVVDGLLALELAISHVEGTDVVVIAQSQWRDFAAMQGFLGENLHRPALWDATEKWLSSVTVEHFEVVIRQVAETEGE